MSRPSGRRHRWPSGHWTDWNPLRRYDLPPTATDAVAGSPCPVSLTPWKLGALRWLGRRFIGIELKPEYFAAAVVNLKAADRQAVLSFGEREASAEEAG